MIAKIPLKHSRGRFGFLLASLFVLIMTRYAFQINIPRVLFLLIIGVIVMLGDRNEIVAMCIACIPMHESVDFFYAMVICMAVYVVKYMNRIRLKINTFLLVLVIIVWELLHSFSTDFSIVYFLAAIIPFIVLAIFISTDAEELDYPFIVRVFAWTVFAISLTLLVRVLYFSDFNIALALAGLQRMGSDDHSNIQDVVVSGGQIHPNSLGIIAVLASTGLMQLRNKRVSKTSDMVLMCIILVFAALGTSRTYLVCLLLMIVLLILSENGGITKKIRLVTSLAGILIVGVVAFSIVFPETFTYFIDRFSESDLSSGRGVLMKDYHAFIVNNLNVMFFGIGLQDYGDRLVYTYNVSFVVPHNSIQEIIVAWGIPGLIIFMVQFIIMYYNSFQRNRQQGLINWIPLIIIFIKGMAGQTLTSSYTMLALSFAYLSLCANLKPTIKTDEMNIIK